MQLSKMKRLSFLIKMYHFLILTITKLEKNFFGILKKLEQHISALPVIGFNSQKYDLNIIKGELFKTLLDVEEVDFQFLVKKINSMSVVETTRLRFLDITNFIAPGFSYEKYLRAFNCKQEKGLFPIRMDG